MMMYPPKKNDLRHKEVREDVGAVLLPEQELIPELTRDGSLQREHRHADIIKGDGAVVGVVDIRKTRVRVGADKAMESSSRR